MSNPVFIALTKEGAKLAASLASDFNGEWHATRAAIAGTKPTQIIEHVSEHTRDLFLAKRPVVGICASGILIRAVASVATSKHDDPPLLAMSDDGSVIIPLLGGHHGGNRLAQELAVKTGGIAAITTAGERAFGIALDEPPAPFVVADLEQAKVAMLGLIDGKRATLTIDLPEELNAVAEAWRAWLEPIADNKGELNFCLTLAPHKTIKSDCVFHPQVITLGLGASRDCPIEEMSDLIDKELAKAKISPQAIKGVYSIDLKADEAAIIKQAERINKRLHLFTAEQLDKETPRLTSPSEIVKREVGCYGVAEGAALAAVGDSGVLLLPKTRSRNATMALGLGLASEESRKRGKVMLIGIGPGQSAWRTPEASAMIASADELVGYGFYLNLLGSLAHGKVLREFALGEEEKRCAYALEEAGKGKDVAVICSGDAGIYAMGALIYELLAKDKVSQAAKRSEIITTPGISALQAAAARSGAILGNDFCAISLSDLLTPFEQIQKRIHAAAQGDFVIAFYNPVSSKRKQAMQKAKEILLKHRPPNTPVVLARNLGRDDESITHRRLKDLSVDEIDMLTVVLVGSSASRSFTQGGEVKVFTPRGYAKYLDSEEK